MKTLGYISNLFKEIFCLSLKETDNNQSGVNRGLGFKQEATAWLLLLFYHVFFTTALGSRILHPSLSLTYANNPVNTFNIHDTVAHFLQMTKPHSNKARRKNMEKRPHV